MSARSLFATALLCSFGACLAAPASHAVSEFAAGHAIPGEIPAAVAADSLGYVYLAGTAHEAGRAARSIYVAKLDPAGRSRLYTAYLNGSVMQQVTAIAVDRSGNVYITGYTSSPDLPMIGGAQKTYGGAVDAFVAKLDPKGTTWLYSTYIGGAGEDIANGIALDREGHAYITGRTSSSDFPLRNAAYLDKAGDVDDFVSEIAADGRTLLYSSFLRGGWRASGNAVAVDASGAIWIAGGRQRTAGETGEAFLLKMAPDGSEPQYVQLLRGSRQQEATGLALDPHAAVYLTGWTDSPDFPVTAGGGASGGRQVFAAKFTDSGEAAYIALMGGAAGEIAPSIAADGLGNAYVAGGTKTSGLLIKLSANGRRILSMDTIASTGAARGMGLALTGAGRAIVAPSGAPGNSPVSAVSTCGFRLPDGAPSIASAGGGANLHIETDSECEWNASSDAAWLEFGGAGSGAGELTLRAAANHGAARQATITIGGETAVVQQAGVRSRPTNMLRTDPGFRAMTLNACDDCSSTQAADLGFAIDFYGQNYTQAWVNANGNITFGGPNGSYTPGPLAGLTTAMIAPFWADVDTRGAAESAVSYGRDVVDGHTAFGVTWTGVGYYARRQDKHDTFQLVLIGRSDLGPGQFDIEMNYSALEWDASEAGARIAARAGFTNGTGSSGAFLELPGSGEWGALLDGGANRLIGRHTFHVASTAAAATAAATLSKAPGSPGSAGATILPLVSVGSITEYPVPISSSEPWGITSGPDGGLWFTDWSGFIGRMTTTGSVSSVPISSSNMRHIIPGPDGALWFVDTGNNKIGRITTSGAITEYAIPTSNSAPHSIVIGPDGAMWFTEFNANKIGRITTAGVITEFTLNNGEPEGIASGSDGALWFTEFQGGINKIGRITTAGVITEFSIPTTGAEASGIVNGPDGALWFTEFNGNKIGRITTAGAFTEYSLPTVGSQPLNIVVGPDGAMWFTQYGSSQIGRITTAGAITEYTTPTTNSLPADITIGPDGAIWFTEFNRGKIGRIFTASTNPPALSITKTHTGNFSPGQQGATYTVTVSNAAGAGATSGTVTVMDVIPGGMTLVSMSGSGWNCPVGASICTRSDALNGGASYAAITVTVNVAADAATPQVNQAIVSGGGSASAMASDSTIITSAASVGAITEFPVSISSSQPWGITAGPDGALWFTDWAGYIGRMTTTGAVTSVSTAAISPRHIITGPDGALWFADTGNSKIGRITTSGTVTEYATPTPNSGPHSIVVGPDGAMWFTEFDANKIGRITTAGTITEFPLTNGEPEGITVGPDGALWFTEFQGGISQIGRITTAGTFTFFPLPTSGAEPYGIVSGPDGALWFTEFNGNKIGRITTSGIITEFPITVPATQPSDMLVGPDGLMWFTQYGSSQIGSITTTGLITAYTIPTANSLPADLAIGSDGAIWFTEFNRAKIGRIVTGTTNPPVLSISKTHTGNFAPGQQGATYTVTVSNAMAAGATSGTVTVTDTAPAGMTLVSMSGSGWTCASGGDSCTRSDSLAPGANYPPITVTVNVLANATTPQVNSASVSGGGSAGASATDSTVINSAASVGTITEYTVPISSSEPYGIASGPDGALWFTDWAGFIGRVTTLGAVTSAPTAATSPRGMAMGPDGALWFADTGNSKIGRVTTAGAITEYATTTPNSAPHRIVAGPDGALWFTEFNANKIGRITTAGTITEFALSNGEPEGITVGPDGALWFTEFQGGVSQIGRITTAGAITTFPVPTSGSEPDGIVAGPDGALWFTDFNGNKIGRITTSGVFTEYPLALAASQPLDIVVGPDGALWFTQYGGNQIGSITTAGMIAEYNVPTANSLPANITVGPDGALWFTEFNRGKIGRIVPGFTDAPILTISMTHIGSFAPGQQGATYTVTVADAAGGGVTNGAVTVTDNVPSGLTLVSMAGAGWTCPSGGNTCTRTDALSAGNSYPTITVTVNVAGNATSPQVNEATVSGGGAASATTTDTAIVTSVPPGTFTEYKPPTTASEPDRIVTGPDGALWFTEAAGNKIGRLTTSGTFTEYTLPTASSAPTGITNGPDGALWFTERNGNKIGRITTAGAFTEYSIPTASSQPAIIITGPDGNLWFTENAAGKIARITPSGTFTEYVVGGSGNPYGITAGPDGALWFTVFNTAFIGRITTAGTITLFNVPTSSAGPYGIVAGPDGALWFAEQTANKIGRITTAGVFTEYPVAVSASQPADIVSGPDGALWFTQFSSNQLGRITLNGLFTEYTVPTTNSEPLGITVGPDNAIWFAEFNAGKIGRTVIGGTVSPALFITKTHTGSFTVGQQGAVYTVTVSNAAGASATTGAVMVTEAPPSGETLVSLSGTGWTCPATGGVPSGSCTRSDALAPGSSYPAIVVTVNVSATASSPQVNTVSVSGGGSGAANTTDSTVIAGGVTAGLALYPVQPCRVADTRTGTGAFGGPIMAAGSTRNFSIPTGNCNIPANAQAYSVNITVVPPGPLQYLTAWPTGQAQPFVSTLNSFNGAVVANAAIVPAGDSGSVSIYVSDATHVIIDINGYFAPPGGVGALAFYPATPCRVADTRTGTGAFAGPSLPAGGTRNFTVPQSSCGIPDTAQAYSLNMTVVPPGPLQYLTTWPTGQPQPFVSTLNAFQGQVAANAAIVPAGTNGAISVYVSDASNVIVDINGYFAPPGGAGALYFYPVPPCRVADTRIATGTFGGPSLGAGGTRTFPMPTSSCGLPAAAQAYSLNMTVVPPGPMFFLSTWPAGVAQPVVSTLNDLQGQVVANAAIVPAGTAGAISVFVSDATNLIIDVNGYFGQ